MKIIAFFMLVVTIIVAFMFCEVIATWLLQLPAILATL